MYKHPNHQTSRIKHEHVIRLLEPAGALSANLTANSTGWHYIISVITQHGGTLHQNSVEAVKLVIKNVLKCSAGD